MGIDPFHQLAVELQYKAQNAMRCRMLRAKIDDIFAVFGFRHDNLRLPMCNTAILRQGSGALTIIERGIAYSSEAC